MAPKGWKEEKLGTLFEFKNGANTEAANYGSGIKFVNVMDVFGNNFITADKIRESVNLSEDKIELYLLKNGDVLFNRTSEVFDEIALTSVYIDTSPAIFGGFVIRGRPKGSDLNFNYCIYCFSSSSVRRESIRRGQGAIRANIGQKDLQRVPMLIPPLSEQKKIADILLTWDRAIEITEKLISNGQQQKKSLMQQLLTGKKRLSGYSSEWITWKLGQLFDERVETHREDLPLLSITSKDGVVYQDDTGRKDTSNSDKSKYRRICVNDIGYNTMRMWQGRSSLSDKEGIVSPAYTILSPKENVCPAFSSYLFKLPELIHVFYRHSQGLVSDTWNLKYNQLKKIKWQLPSIEEQKAIASVLSSTDKEIETLQQKLEFFKQEKKALMQQLLTGKRRVKIEEEDLQGEVT